jgi:CDP-6-deoxy-D-xylo-4-hexulose-3-dehydrase
MNNDLKNKINQYYRTRLSPKKFVPGQTYVPVSGKVFGSSELENGIQAILDGWWTEGVFAKKFESEFKRLLGIKYVSLANSGSSANLIALMALTNRNLKDKRLKPGDEFITTPVAFPTTINPGIFFGLKPVFVDADQKTFNIDAKQIAKAITKKTKLIMLAHTLGKPFDLTTILPIVRKHKLWLIEDCCDALGSKYNHQPLGTFGHIATFSFYPAHQITMGEGGAVVTNDPRLHRSIRQYRDWGRDCWCDTGKDNTCARRFSQQHGQLPYGYDHKYVYSQLGFNLKLTDMQAAIGLAQLKRLPLFIKQRQKNYQKLHAFFSEYPNFFRLLTINPKENPCWFGFPFIIRKEAPFSRNDLAVYLEKHKIGTRNVFSGNILCHPAYMDIKNKMKVVGRMDNADIIMNQAMWLGVYPGIKAPMINYVKNTITRFLQQYGQTKTNISHHPLL